MKLIDVKLNQKLVELFKQNKYYRQYKYKEEIDWWRYILIPGNREDWMRNAIDPGSRIKHQPPMIINFIQELNLDRIIKVLDVGSGPLSPLAWCVDQKMITVTAIDPLAEIYTEVLELYKIDYPIKPVYGRGEELAEMFEKGEFDIVYTRNAIDHSDSPSKCVINMITVLRQGGFLYMEGFINEGVRNNYHGLHRWNLTLDENNNLICTNKQRQKINITKDLPITCQYTYGPDTNNWYSIAYRRDLH